MTERLSGSWERWQGASLCVKTHLIIWLPGLHMAFKTFFSVNNMKQSQKKDEKPSSSVTYFLVYAIVIAVHSMLFESYREGCPSTIRGSCLCETRQCPGFCVFIVPLPQSLLRLMWWEPPLPKQLAGPRSSDKYTKMLTWPRRFETDGKSYEFLFIMQCFYKGT